MLNLFYFLCSKPALFDDQWVREKIPFERRMFILQLSEEIRCSEVGVSSIKKPSVDFEVGYKFSCFRIMHCWKFVCI